MKILVVSDTHGNYLAPLAFIEESGAELLIHLGDEIADATALEHLTHIPVLKVPGNCDPYAREPRELLESVSGHKFFMTHGDTFRVKAGLEKLVQKGQEIRAAVILFGHTHKPLIEKRDGILLINPGTLMPASDSKSYAVITVTPAKISAEIVHLP